MSGSVAWPSFEAVWALAEPVIKAAEGLRLMPYLCATSHWTIGWGTTNYPDGRAVTSRDQPVSEIEAQVFLEYAAKRKYAELQRSGAVTRDPSVHQAAALLSLAYNIGVGIHDGIKGDLADSTLLDRFNAGDVPGAADQFLKWNKGHVSGELVVIAGLTKRRRIERAIFLTPDLLAA